MSFLVLALSIPATIMPLLVVVAPSRATLFQVAIFLLAFAVVDVYFPAISWAHFRQVEPLGSAATRPPPRQLTIAATGLLTIAIAAWIEAGRRTPFSWRSWIGPETRGNA